ncbi:MAG TPA: beta-galactosidase trimerization domain-containing protein, partial [Acidobacteriaceae bacterium]|nr:beta-galactosidase trimerization domain-containing protein [Acidobacteriaceae bacterium]
WVTCALGPYNFDFMTEVHKEITQKYRPDGIFMNRWDGSGDCYCESCRTNFRKATGLELPRTQDPHDAGRRAFLEWRRQRLIDVLDLWNGEMRAINPVSSIVPNNGSGAQSPLNAVETSRRAPMLAADRQARHGLEAPWLVGKSAKEYRATMGDKPVIGLFGIGLEEPERWKDSVTSNAEIRIWALEAIANGMRPWFSKFSGTLRDQRWLSEIEDLYQWTARNDSYLNGRRPMARVALVYSQQTNWYVPEGKAEDAALGWYQALVESRIPFEMVHDRLLDEVALAKYRTLVLPNIVALSDAQCGQIKAFVSRGGNVVATNQTSLSDEWGARRKNFGLAELFGVDWSGKIESRMQNSYIRLEHESAKGSAMFAGLEDAPRVINGVSRVETTPRERFTETAFTLIPSYPDLPMEKVYPRVAKTDVSCLYLRQAGGRVAYFPFDIDRTFWEVLCEDHLKMMRNALLWAHDEPRGVEVEGPGLLDVTAWRNAHAITVHLVNLTNPMALKGPYRDFFPVGPHTVKVRLPEGVEAKRVRLLGSGTDAQMSRRGRTLNITVPSIRDHEVVAVEV